MPEGFIGLFCFRSSFLVYTFHDKVEVEPEEDEYICVFIRHYFPRRCPVPLKQRFVPTCCKVLGVIHNYHHFHKRTNRTLFLTPPPLESVQM